MKQEPAQRIMICTPKVRHFWGAYFMTKRGQQRKYSAEFKIGVIMDMREHRLGYRETARKYWDVSGGQEINYVNAVKRWERIFLEEGAAGLMKERRGNARATRGAPKGRPPKLDPQVEEDLITENQRLRMEIEYLKKLSALVLAEEQKNGKKP